jgi:hypothetical protein
MLQLTFDLAQSCRCLAEPEKYGERSLKKIFHEDLPRWHKECCMKEQNQLILAQENLGSIKAPCRCSAAKGHVLQDLRPHGVL